MPIFIAGPDETKIPLKHHHQLTSPPGQRGEKAVLAKATSDKIPPPEAVENDPVPKVAESETEETEPNVVRAEREQ